MTKRKKNAKIEKIKWNTIKIVEQKVWCVLLLKEIEQVDMGRGKCMRLPVVNERWKVSRFHLK